MPGSEGKGEATNEETGDGTVARDAQQIAAWFKRFFEVQGDGPSDDLAWGCTEVVSDSSAYLRLAAFMREVEAAEREDRQRSAGRELGKAIGVDPELPDGEQWRQVCQAYADGAFVVKNPPSRSRSPGRPKNLDGEGVDERRRAVVDSIKEFFEAGGQIWSDAEVISLLVGTRSNPDLANRPVPQLFRSSKASLQNSVSRARQRRRLIDGEGSIGGLF